MSKFNSLYEALIMEMPYVDVEQDGETIKFDLELEKYAHDLDGFKAILSKLLHDGTVTDKYGNTINLTTHDERLNFLKTLNNNDVVNLFLTKYHKTNLVNLVNSIK